MQKTDEKLLKMTYFTMVNKDLDNRMRLKRAMTKEEIQALKDLHL